jgi:hypothetical protein
MNSLNDGHTPHALQNTIKAAFDSSSPFIPSFKHIVACVQTLAKYHTEGINVA